MVAPTHTVILIGELSDWATQFVGGLSQHAWIKVERSASAEQFVASKKAALTAAMVLIENNPKSQAAILTLRKSLQPMFLIWFGQSFSKEDLEFAITHRIYAVSDASQPDQTDPSAIIKNLSDHMEQQKTYRDVVRAIKTVLLDANSAEPDPAVLGEVKTAIAKLEKIGISDEFLAGSKAANASAEALPFFKDAALSDAMTTVHQLQRTGTLKIVGNEGKSTGEINFLQGKPMGARCAEVVGTKAIYRMFLWDNPSFQFVRHDPNDFAVESNIQESVAELSEFGDSMKERFEKIRKSLPPGHLKVDLEAATVGPGVGVTPDQFSVLASVVEFKKVGMVLNYNTLPDVTIYEALIELRRQKLLRIR